MGNLRVQYQTIEKLYGDRFSLAREEIASLSQQFNVLKDKETVVASILGHIARSYRKRNMKALVFRFLKKHRD